jgi:hypothetical protein
MAGAHEMAKPCQRSRAELRMVDRPPAGAVGEVGSDGNRGVDEAPDLAWRGNGSGEQQPVHPLGEEALELHRHETHRMFAVAHEQDVVVAPGDLARATEPLGVERRKGGQQDADRLRGGAAQAASVRARPISETPRDREHPPPRGRARGPTPGESA